MHHACLIRKREAKMHASSLAAPVECCMCGDRGLEEELFKCRKCSVRLQHKYCSNLYPKLHRYLACNWCLGEGEKLQAPRESACSSFRGLVGGVKLRRGAFKPLINEQHVKKQKFPPHHRRKGTTSAGCCRVKVRRYKLLDEVCS